MSDGDLGDLFARQDGAIARNLASNPETFSLVADGLKIGLAITMFLNEGRALARRLSRPADRRGTEQAIANLLHAAWAALVTATRLALYGAQVDSFALTRGAFEAAYHAEYFRHKPEDFVEWDKAGQITDLYARATMVDAFAQRHHVRRWLDTNDGLDRRRMFVELSTYGSHANPMTVGLRLSTPIPGAANLGFVSIGKPESVRLCALHALHVLAYVLSEFGDQFAIDLEQNAELMKSCELFRERFQAIHNAAPLGLSLLR